MLVQTYDLASLGWTPELSGAFASHAMQGLIPGRVGARHRGRMVVYTPTGEIAAAHLVASVTPPRCRWWETGWQSV
jgi:hypothetical protein